MTDDPWCGRVLPWSPLPPWRFTVCQLDHPILCHGGDQIPAHLRSEIPWCLRYQFECDKESGYAMQWFRRVSFCARSAGYVQGYAAWQIIQDAK